MDVPVQNEKEMEQVHEKSESSSKGFVISNIFLLFVFSLSFNQIFSSVNSLQITAHMPLIKQPLISSCYLIYDVLIKVMMFDFFEVHEYYDFGFTSTDSWNTLFTWLKYDSSNFFELLGSNNIFITALAIQLLAILIVSKLGITFKSKFLRKMFSLKGYKQRLFTFLLEIFFELVLCGVVAFKMFEVRS